MTRDEALERLQIIQSKGSKALLLLDSRPLFPGTQTELRSLVQWLKDELQREYERMLPERVQRSMTMFELSVYCPTIEETWKKTGISRLKVNGVPDRRWREPLEGVVYNAGKYLS